MTVIRDYVLRETCCCRLSQGVHRKCLRCQLYSHDYIFNTTLNHRMGMKPSRGIGVTLVHLQAHSYALLSCGGLGAVVS